MKEPAAYQAASVEPQTLESATSPLVDAGVDVSRAKRTTTPAPGLTFPRFFSEPGVDPFDEVEWDLRTAVIATERGEVVFEQRDVEIPESW
jgi:ribonucleoside-diphosphate reductase alpha chain